MRQNTVYMRRSAASSVVIRACGTTAPSIHDWGWFWLCSFGNWFSGLCFWWRRWRLRRSRLPPGCVSGVDIV